MSDCLIQRYRVLLTRALVAVGVFGGVSGCSPDDPSPDPAIAAVVAQNLDPLNGLPTVVVNGFWCEFRTEECLPGPSGAGLSPTDATAFAGTLAQSLGVPLVEPVGFRSPACPWTAGESGEEGLYAEFLRPPVIQGDSASVELSTGCRENGEAFEQVHRFVLYRARTGWVITRRELTSIT
jgi:hypothetical protein